MTAITGSNITTFQAIVVRSALRMYLETGIKANTAYTPKNMVATAERITGTTIPRGPWRIRMQQARDNLTAFIDQYTKGCA